MVLQCVAVWYSVLQCDTACCSARLSIFGLRTIVNWLCVSLMYLLFAFMIKQIDIGWLRLGGSFKSQVFYVTYFFFFSALLQEPYYFKEPVKCRRSTCEVMSKYIHIPELCIQIDITRALVHYTYIYMYMYMCTCMCVYAYIEMYIFDLMYILMYVYIYVYVCIHIRIYFLINMHIEHLALYVYSVCMCID